MFRQKQLQHKYAVIVTYTTSIDNYSLTEHT